jgi:hypothetical protein
VCLVREPECLVREPECLAREPVCLAREPVCLVALEKRWLRIQQINSSAFFETADI